MVQKFKTLTDAIALAEFAHRNQVDKAGLPYIEHPRRVLAAVQAQGALPYVQMAAILHDVTEDTAFTPEILLGLGFPESAVEIVKLLDRGHSEYYHGKLLATAEIKKSRVLPLTGDERLAWLHPVKDFYYVMIRRNKGARLVKEADIGDNLQPWRLSYLTEDTQDRLKNKYDLALRILREND